MLEFSVPYIPRFRIFVFNHCCGSHSKCGYKLWVYHILFPDHSYMFFLSSPVLLKLILLKFSLHWRTTVYVIIFSCKLSLFIVEDISWYMRPITCTRPRSCLLLFIFTYFNFDWWDYSCYIINPLFYISQEVWKQHVFGISIRINVFI